MISICISMINEWIGMTPMSAPEQERICVTYRSKTNTANLLLVLLLVLVGQNTANLDTTRKPIK